MILSDILTDFLDLLVKSACFHRVVVFQGHSLKDPGSCSAKLTQFVIIMRVINILTRFLGLSGALTSHSDFLAIARRDDIKLT
jgi:hypothetical protein